MRRIALLVAVVAVAALATPAWAQDDQNCSDFPSQAAAQAHLRADPSDPDGLDAHPGPADGNDQAGGDGIACESNPAPFDREPVFAGPPPTEPPPTEPPPTEPPPTEAPPTTVAPLPFTGPSPWLLPFGAGALILGVLILASLRRSGKHETR
jgi:hypothetical protein